MFSHIVVKGDGNAEATVVICGDAVFTHAKEMQGALSQALDGCDHLTIDVGMVGASDMTLRALLCSLHRRSEIGKKSINIVGYLPGQDQARHARVKGCLFKRPFERCALWRQVQEKPRPG